ncbi:MULTISPECIES: hypothetical protein [Streptomyces]|uniref:hypothetical protein n=1 Tax=Streptomyces TaxID=1883 RepID=UPI0027E2EA5A|nr:MULTISPECIES: hypothetical protein [Streptomyces]
MTEVVYAMAPGIAVAASRSAAANATAAGAGDRPRSVAATYLTDVDRLAEWAPYATGSSPAPRRRA